MPRIARDLMTWPPAWQHVCALFAVGATLLFTISLVQRLDETQHEQRLIPDLPYDARTDYNYFYASATMALYGEASALYPSSGDKTVAPGDPAFASARDDDERARLLTRGAYYNPPALALLQAPLAAFDFKTSYRLFTALSLLALAAFLALAWRKGRRIPELPLFMLGALAFRPVHEVLIMGHPTFFFLAALTGGLMLVKAERPVLAGLVLSLLVLNPQWAVLPGLYLLVRGEWRAFGMMLAAAAVIFIVPFIYTGFETFENYVRVTREVSAADLRDAPHMFSWNGFLFKLNGGPAYGHEPPPRLAIFALVALALPFLVYVWASRDYLLGAAATVLTMLLVSVHSVWYDWALLLAAGLFLVLRAPSMSRGMRVEMWVVMMLVFTQASASINTLLFPDRHAIDWHARGLFLVTPVAFGALVWMASVAWREGLVKLGQTPLASKRAPTA
jgi:hypothetical protein